MREPPDPISNSEVKTFSADGSVGSPHVRVGHRQDFKQNPVGFGRWGFFMGETPVVQVWALHSDLTLDSMSCKEVTEGKYKQRKYTFFGYKCMVPRGIGSHSRDKTNRRNLCRILT